MNSPLVFLSHGSSQHALAIALGHRLRQAGFEPFVYDPRAERPPSQVDEWDCMQNVWADIETAGDIVNISHLRDPLERAGYVVLLDEAEAVDGITSSHTQGEMMYAGWLSRLTRDGPAAIGMRPARARELVLDGGRDELRLTLHDVHRRHRRRLTMPRLSIALGLVLAGVAASAFVAPPGSTQLLACLIVLALGLPVWAVAASLPRWMLPFGRAAFLGEVNRFSPTVTSLFGHPTRQMSDGDVVENVLAEVRRDILIAQWGTWRRAILTAIVVLPSLLLMVVLPLAILVGLATIAWVLA